MVSSTEKARARFIDWLNDRLDRANVVQGRGRGAALAKRYKVTPQFANDWLGGRKMPSSLKLLEIVADLEGMEPSSELEAYQLIARQQFKVKDGDEIRVAAREISPGYVRLPLLQMEAGMGFDAYSDEPSEVVEYLDVAEWWAQANLPKPTARIKIITGRGDSNAGVINHGDIVFVDTATNYFDGEGFYVFNWNGRALIKRLVPNLRTGKLQIVSANPAYPAEDISAEEIDQLHIAGRVSAWYTLRTH